MFDFTLVQLGPHILDTDRVSRMPLRTQLDQFVGGTVRSRAVRVLRDRIVMGEIQPGTKIDLGIDPGTPPPTLEDLPTDLMKPVKDIMAPWLAWRVPSHTAACPVWNASPAIAGHVFAINVSYHCEVIEQWRTLIAGIAMAGWIIIAALRILKESSAGRGQA